jgi:two-component system chemotaxis response regulator CheY
MAVDYNMPILIVDDYRTMLKIIRNLLKQLGFTNVEEATDGSEALGKLREGEFDLVISDWNMEPMAVYNHYSREQDRERCCGEGSRCQQLYRQAI